MKREVKKNKNKNKDLLQLIIVSSGYFASRWGQSKSRVLYLKINFATKDNHAFDIAVSPGVHILFSVFVVIYKLYHVETPFPGSLDLLLWVF